MYYLLSALLGNRVTISLKSGVIFVGKISKVDKKEEFITLMGNPRFFNKSDLTDRKRYFIKIPQIEFVGDDG